jgi:hypothetical protein
MKKYFLFLCLSYLCQLTYSQSKYDLNAKISGYNSKINVEVTLKNNTNDTLKYYTMSCSWEDNYVLNTRKIGIEKHSCDKNIPVLTSLAPYESKTVIINLSPVTRHIMGLKLKIGIALIEDSSLLPYTEINKNVNIIWSNEIKI